MAPEQIRMARAALRLGVRDLAKLADIAPATLTRFETEKGGINMATAERLKSALESAGVEFITENGRGPGVRLRKQGD